MFPWWEQALYLAAVASSPVRTEGQAGLGDLASLHVTVKVLRPHVSGRRRPNTNSAIYPFRGEKTHLVHTKWPHRDAARRSRGARHHPPHVPSPGHVPRHRGCAFV